MVLVGRDLANALDCRLKQPRHSRTTFGFLHNKCAVVHSLVNYSPNSQQGGGVKIDRKSRGPRVDRFGKLDQIADCAW